MMNLAASSSASASILAAWEEISSTALTLERYNYHLRNQTHFSISYDLDV